MALFQLDESFFKFIRKTSSCFFSSVSSRAITHPHIFPETSTHTIYFSSSSLFICANHAIKFLNNCDGTCHFHIKINCNNFSVLSSCATRSKISAVFFFFPWSEKRYFAQDFPASNRYGATGHVFDLICQEHTHIQ